MEKRMAEPVPIVLIPGLIASPRFYAAQVPHLWRHGPVTIADHKRDDSMAAIARRILSTAPLRFALGGHSMGGYIALEIMRQAADRVVKLALLDTAATPDQPEQTEKRRAQIALVKEGRFAEVVAALYPVFVHPSRKDDASLREALRLMAEDNGPEAFIRQQTAIMGRPDSRGDLARIACPTLVLVGDADVPTPPERAQELAAGIPGARLVTVPECGHMSAMERPEAVTQAMVAWLSG
jgi:pimeloyl-ACP methyl ester carboxylesterase